MRKRLQHKVVFITHMGRTGLYSGNGRAMSASFAHDGGRVFMGSRDQEALHEMVARVGEDGGRIGAAACDVTDSAAVASMTAQCRDTCGPIDIFVDEVGGSAADGLDQPEEVGWEGQTALDLSSVYLTRERVLLSMEAQGGSAITNVSSTSKLNATDAAQTAHAVAKADVLRLSKVVAHEYATKGVGVRAVVPEQLHMSMVTGRLACQHAGGKIQALRRQRPRRVPPSSMRGGRNVANTALFVVSDEACSFADAETMVDDGGLKVRCG